MKFFLLILIVFFKTGNLLSDNNLFNVNNILIKKEVNTSNNQLANKAIQEGFNQLIKKILLKEDIKKINNLSFSKIKELVTFYNIEKKSEKKENTVNFNITFDKNKIHDLLYQKGILYSDIIDKEFYILPIILSKNEIFIFSNNYFYENWNVIQKDQLLEYILPLENIEIIQNINKSKDNLFDLELNLLFKEYSKKNLAIALIENANSESSKIYLKTRVQNKIFSKNLNIKTLNETDLKEKIIFEIKEEILNLVKSQNLIDIRAPSFLNVKFNLNKKNNLFLLKSKMKNVDLIENVFVQEFNKDNVSLKIKYFGKLEKIINQLNNENIFLELRNDQWYIKIL